MKKYFKMLFYGFYFVSVILFVTLIAQTLIRSNKPTPIVFKKYTGYFTLKTGSYVGYPFIFTYSNDNILGTCVMFDKYPFYVSINNKHWKRLSNVEKILLIFHEAGHCSNNLKHDDSELEDGCPKSLMNSNLPTHYCIDKQGIEYYLDEFKGRLE